MFSSYSISTIDVTLTLSNVTVADNVADGEGVGAGDGGGVFLGVGEADVRNTIIAGNVDPGGEAPDCGGQPLTSHGHNLIRNTTGCTLTGDLTGNVTADPLLGPLQNNGGPTKTHALLPGSAARDTGNPAAPGSGGDACLAGDQRAVARPIAACDIGATESSCGDHVQDPGEQCDDGNLTDGDGCDSSCTTTACGNGVVTTGEECDDGPANGADGCCSSTCTLVDADGDGVCDRDDPCTGTRVITIPHVSVTNLDKAGNESIRVSGETRLPFPINPPLDPLAHGVRFILSGTAGPILDTGIPAVPGVLAQWKVSGSGRRWLYVRLPPGIVRFALLDKSPTVPGLVRFVITGIHFPLALSPSVLPLRMLVVLDGTRTTSAQCAQATPTCTFNATVRRVACK